MRHRKAGVKLNRTTSHRQAMFRNMVTSLFKHDRIKTTDTKAKELRRWADRIITLAKRGDLNARRQALAIVREKEVVHKLFDEAQKRFGKINGGYTRITKLGFRPGDKASISLIELISVEAKPKKKKKKAAPKKETAAAATTAKKKTAEKETAAEAPEKAAAKDDAVKAADDKKEAKPAAKKAPAKKAPAKKAKAKEDEAAPKAAKAPAKKAAAKKDAPKAEAKKKAPAKKESKDKE